MSTAPRRTVAALAPLTLGLTALALPLTAAPAHAEVVDTAPPVVTVKVPDVDGSNGWYRTHPTVKISSRDLSGIDTEASSVTVSGAVERSLGVDGIGAASVVLDADGASTVSWEIHDREGNVARGSRVLSVDATAPIPTLNVVGGTTVARVGDQVAFTLRCDEATSGVAECVTGGDLHGGSAAGVLIDTRTPGDKTVYVRATDNAGNTATTTRTVHVVATGDRPVVTFDALAPNGSNGWFRTPASVTARATPTDAEATIDTTSIGYAGEGAMTAKGSSANILVRREGTTPVTGSTVDVLGQTGTASVTVKVDTVAPSITAPALPASVVQGTRVSVAPSCADATSGVAECVLTDGVAGGLLDTAQAGTRSVKGYALDAAGNRTAFEASYVVTAPTQQTGGSGNGTGSTTGTTTNPTQASVKTATVSGSAKVTGRKATLAIATVNAPAGTQVVVREGSKVVATGVVGADGKVKLVAEGLKRGKHKLAVTVSATATSTAATTVVKVRIR